jgi:hypothetical protein
MSAALWLGLSAGANEPTNSFRIEPYLTHAMLVHVDTQANRRYEVQFSTNLAAPAAMRWRKVYVAEAFPFPNHFILYHETTNGPAGWFRLVITP